jgi:CSLREA domain-containing protein
MKIRRELYVIKNHGTEGAEMNNSRFLKPITFFVLIVTLSSLLWAVSPIRPAFAGTINVGTNIDEFNNNGLCSLREAVTAANTDTAVDACPAGNGTDTINLPPDFIVTDLVGAGEDLNMTGDYDIKSDIIFKGAENGSTVIDGSQLDRVFQIFPGGSAQFEGVTIADGDPGSAAGGNINVYGGDLILINSSVRVAAGGDGIFAVSGSTVTILNSHIETNTASGLNLLAGATAIIRNSTIFANGNGAMYGGGILNEGTLTIINSTISGNISTIDGGGIANWGTAHLYNVTITNNQADYDYNNTGNGGGIYNDPTGTLTIQNIILAGNTDGINASYAKPDCSGTLTSAGFNLIQEITGCTITGVTTGNITGLDPLLGPLQDNGGPTFTHALLTGSPAINAGNPAGCTDQNGVLLGTDQRGYVRNGVCDKGAYEYNSIGTPTPTLTTIVIKDYLPLVFNHYSGSGILTSTPTPTGAAATLTPTPNTTTTATNTPTPTATKTATPTQNHTPLALTPTALEGYGYVTILDNDYQPNLITIHAGRIVTWENTGLTDHSVTSNTGVWDSGTLAPGQKFQYTFTTAGNYPYHCSFHPEMIGMVIVVP